MQVQTLINGQVAECVAPTDRGLAYGHGLFETLPVQDGKPIFLSQHQQRLLDGCARLGIPTDNLMAQLQQDLGRLKFPAGMAVLKIMVTSGSGGRGYLRPDPVEPCRILSLSPMPVYPDMPEDGIHARWCQTRLACQPLLSGIKHLNRLEQVLARNEWRDPGIREGLVLDTLGRVVEGTMSNLLFVRGQHLCTPDLSEAGVSGIVRAQLLSMAPELGLEVEVGQYDRDSVESADEVMVCNSLIGIWPIVRLGDVRYPVGPHTRNLQSALKQRMSSC
ncbi:aminodeoxychorismate lyase [Marinobacterium weihaiense]|uniref:Aminodeoxychorismate lyase n=1 Tax=Marinobacterium weihaiense TaxID=2851016 RepID=A0ABS6M6D2_9GAMM|nr:aminodeoxychorismate lyase [Marinobacterium weihaiense]MBV0931833.1 aminodeoxychorismate lyase [Marinobacterium weihaiense]